MGFLLFCFSALLGNDGGEGIGGIILGEPGEGIVGVVSGLLGGLVGGADAEGSDVPKEVLLVVCIDVCQ